MEAIFLCNSILRNRATSQELFHYDVRRIRNTIRITVVVLQKVRIWVMDSGAHIRGGCGGGCDTPPAFQNRSKVGPEKFILDNQFGPRFGPRTSDILDRYIYIIKIN